MLSTSGIWLGRCPRMVGRNELRAPFPRCSLDPYDSDMGAPPNGGPPPHRHRHEDEMFLIVEGSIQFLANGEWTEPLEPGSIVYTPRGAVHTFQNVGETPCRQFVIATPSGFELFFSKSAAAGEGSMPDLARRLAISEEHQIEFVPPLAVPQ